MVNEYNHINIFMSIPKVCRVGGKNNSELVNSGSQHLVRLHICNSERTVRWEVVMQQQL